MDQFKPLNPDHFYAFVYYHFIEELKYKIPDFHKELIQLTRYARVAVAAPRKFAKSTYMSEYYPLFFALEKPGSTITLISASHTMACEWISKIRRALDTSSSIRDFYGEQSPKLKNEVGKWTEDELHLSNGSVIRGRGAGQQIRGGENHLIVCDDLETNETAASSEQTKGMFDWLRADVIGSTMPWSQVIVVGTILHPDSVLNRLILSPPTDEWINRKYIAQQPDRSSLWEDMWSAEYLVRRRQEIGDVLFEQEYQNNPIPDDQRKFRPEHIQYFETEPPGCVYFVACDTGNKLVGSKGAKTDPTAIVTVAVDTEHNWWVVDVINKHLTPSETIDRLFNLHQRYKFVSAGIESVVYETVYKKEVEYQSMKKGRYPLVIELKHAGRRKEMRIEGLQPRFEAKKVFIKKDQTALETQLLRFPSLAEHDDVIDALAYITDIYRPASDNEIRRVNPNSFEAALIQCYEQGNEASFWGNDKQIPSSLIPRD